MFDLKYTDIDYTVFTDGARYLREGRSPFLRHGYRYSPIFSLLVFPNVFLFHYGKFLFALFDVLNGYLIFKILSHSNCRLDPKLAKLSSLIWLYNPFSMIISTRGSADSFITLLVLSTLLCLVNQNYALSGIIFGLVIHCKIYPVIFSLGLYLFLSGPVKSRWSFQTWSPFNTKRLTFFISALFSFTLLTYAYYQRYGQLYIKEAWTYHLNRKDLDHNFSPYFYIYKVLKSDNLQSKLSMIAFLPQVLSILYYSLRYCIQLKAFNYANLWFALFSQTYLFVSLNKVATSQYFIWYLSLLPLVYPFLNVTTKQSFSLLILWLSSQAFWLLFAYLYQYLKLKVLFYVWLCSILFLLINLFIQAQLEFKFQSQAKKVN